MKISILALFIFSVLLCTNPVRGQQNIISSNSLTRRMLNPIATDSTLMNFRQGVPVMGGFDISFTKTPKRIRQYSSFYGYGDPIVMHQDTVYLHIDAHFNTLGKVTKIESDEEVFRFYYDEKGNLLQRELHTYEQLYDTNIKTRKKAYIEQMSYDEYGNLRSYYEYEIAKGAVYNFEAYKEYTYQKQKDTTIVTIQSVEKTGNYFCIYTTTKTYDNFDRVLSFKKDGYYPISKKKTSIVFEYTYETIRGKSYVTSVKTTMPLVNTQEAVESYKRDAYGRLIETKDETIQYGTRKTYQSLVTYPKRNEKVTKQFFSSNIPPEERSSAYSKKDGLQKIITETFDKHGNTTKKVVISHDEEMVTKHIKLLDYTYDEHLNWTSQTSIEKYEYTPNATDGKDIEYEPSDPDVEKFYREISYFSSSEKLIESPKSDEKAEMLKKDVLSKYFRKN